MYDRPSRSYRGLCESSFRRCIPSDALCWTKRKTDFELGRGCGWIVVLAMWIFTFAEWKKWIFTIVSEQKVNFHFLEIENLQICDNFWIGQYDVDYDHNFTVAIDRMFALIYRIEAYLYSCFMKNHKSEAKNGIKYSESDFWCWQNDTFVIN